MATGACGIDCDVCRLNRRGICSSCGPADSREADAKVETQRALFGHPCPLLDCARRRGVRHCLGDCDEFPCPQHADGQYPFGQGYLNMQQRRRKEASAERPGGQLQVPPEHWEQVAALDRAAACRRALCAPGPGNTLELEVFGRTARIDPAQRRVTGEPFDWADGNLCALLVLVYLLNAAESGETGEMIGVHDLRDAWFFQGPHALPVAALLARYGNDLGGFTRAAVRLGGQAIPGADAAFTLRPLPKIPLHLLLWAGDEEFGPNLSILFDRSIERHLAADGIWGAVNLTADGLLRQ